MIWPRAAKAWRQQGIKRRRACGQRLGGGGVAETREEVVCWSCAAGRGVATAENREEAGRGQRRGNGGANPRFTCDFTGYRGGILIFTGQNLFQVS